MAEFRRPVGARHHHHRVHGDNHDRQRLSHHHAEPENYRCRPEGGKNAKQRSTHNNYLTLPVIFLMLSNLNPLAFATEYNWIIASLVFLMGVTIWHYFNTMHTRSGKDVRWTWFVITTLFFAIVWLSTIGTLEPRDSDVEASMTPQESRFADAEGFDEVYDTVLSRCAMCHAEELALGYLRGERTSHGKVVIETGLENV